MKRNRGFIDLSILFLAFTAVSLSSLIAFLAESTKVEQVPEKVKIMVVEGGSCSPEGSFNVDCTGQRQSCNEDAGVGKVYKCESGKWVFKYPECNTRCKVSTPVQPTQGPQVPASDCKKDKTGASNPACCCGASDCPTGQVCNVPNGYCQSGVSCNDSPDQKYHKECKFDASQSKNICAETPGPGQDKCTANCQCTNSCPKATPTPNLTVSPTVTPTPSCLAGGSLCTTSGRPCCVNFSCQPSLVFYGLSTCQTTSNLTPTPQSGYLTPTLAPSRCSLSSCTPLTSLICQQMGCEWRNNQCCPPTGPQPTTRPISTPTLAPCRCLNGFWQGGCDSNVIGRSCIQPTTKPTSIPTPTSSPLSQICDPSHPEARCKILCGVNEDQFDNPFGGDSDCRRIGGVWTTQIHCCAPKPTSTPQPTPTSRPPIPTVPPVSSICDPNHPEARCKIMCGVNEEKFNDSWDGDSDCRRIGGAWTTQIHCCGPKPTPTIIPNFERCWPRYGGECSFACTITKYRGYVETPDCTTEGKKCCLLKLTPTPIPYEKSCAGKYPGGRCAVLCQGENNEFTTTPDCDPGICCYPLKPPTPTPTFIPYNESCIGKFGGTCLPGCPSVLYRGTAQTPDCSGIMGKCCLPKLTPTPIPYNQSCAGKYGGSCLPRNLCFPLRPLGDKAFVSTPDCGKIQICCYSTKPTPTPIPYEKSCAGKHPGGGCAGLCVSEDYDFEQTPDCAPGICCYPKVTPAPKPAGYINIDGNVFTTGKQSLLPLFIKPVLAQDKTVVPFAQVIVTDNLGRTYETQADENGHFQLNVPAGFTYKMTVKAPGYKAAERTMGYADFEKKYQTDVNLIEGQETEKTETIKINAVTKPKTLKLSSGWSLVTLPLAPKTPFTASSLLKEINQQGGDAVMISRLENGGWQTYVLDLVGVDFEIEIGQAYFIFNNQEVEVSLAGEEVTAIPYNLSAGWNAVGFPKKLTPAQSAATTIDYLSTKQCSNETIEQCGNILSLSQFTSGLWETFLKDKGQVFGSDFYTEKSQGYLLKLKLPLKLTP